MDRLALWATLFALSPLIAQTTPPRPLPKSIEKPNKVEEELQSFDPFRLELRFIDKRWVIHHGDVPIKEFGSNRDAAVEAIRAVQDIRANQLGSVPGGRPPFEYFLTDGKPSRHVNGKVTIVPINSRGIRAEQIGGAWVVTDGLKSLHDFGANEASAKQAAAIYLKYGFNQLGIVGGDSPIMVYPIFDQRHADREARTPPINQEPLKVVGEVAQTSFLLPGNVYGGPKYPIDHSKVAIERRSGEWHLFHGEHVLGKFGTNELAARHALKAMQDSKPNEVAFVGARRLPVFLSHGAAIRGDAMGAIRQTINPDRVKVQQVRDTWWVYDDSRPVLEIGTKSEAIVMVKAIQALGIRSISTLGRVDQGMLFMTAGR